MVRKQEVTWQRARLVGGAAILAVVVWQVGAQPFGAAFQVITPWSVACALLITGFTTVCCAWRWRTVAAALGEDVPLSAAVGACYRSLFLNVTLPGGVLGDVHRGIRQGRSGGDLGRSLRSVGWERTSGQAVQAALTAAVLLVVAWPAGAMALAACASVIALVLAVRPEGRGTVRDAPARVGDPDEDAPEALGTAAPDTGRTDAPARSRAARLVAADLRALLARGAWPGIVLASFFAVCGYVTLFVVALQTAGAPLPATRMVPVALIVLLGGAIPLNLAGWGPREGVAAWALGTAGLSAAVGVTVAVVYGVLVLVSAVPGAFLLAADRRGAARAPDPDPNPSTSVRLSGWHRTNGEAPAAGVEGVTHG